MKQRIVIPLVLSLIASLVSTARAEDVWEAFLTQRGALDLVREGRYVWVGTEGGVMRWDAEGTGVDASRYDVFLPQDGLAAVTVVSVAVDRHGTKWFAHSLPDIGVSILDSAGNWSVISSFDGLGLEAGRGVNVVRAFGDSVWVGTSSGATLFENRERKILLTEDDDGIVSDRILSIESSGGELWLGTDRGLTRYDRFGVRNYTMQTDSLPDNRINALAVDRNGKLWIGTDSGVGWIVDNEVVPVEGLIALRSLVVRDITFETDTGGEVIPWFATNNGPYRENIRFAQLSDGGQIGDPAQCNAILADEFGDVWLANGNRWIFDFDFFVQGWHQRRLPGLVTNFMSDLIIDKDGYVWTANFSNLDEKPDGDARNIHFYNGLAWTNINLPSYLELVVGAALDSAGNRWFCSRNTGADAGDRGNIFMLPAEFNTTPTADDFEYYNVAGDELGWDEGADPTYNIEVDPSGNVWGCVTRRGVAALDSLRDEQRWGVWTSNQFGGTCLHDDPFAAGVNAPSPVDITFTPDGRAWVALELSLVSVIDYGSSLDNPADDFCFDWGFQTSPIPNKQRIIRADPRGRVWFGTESGGLVRFDPADSTWAAYTSISTNGGLPDDRIRGIAFDRAGNTWVGTLGGGIGILRPDGETWLEPYRVESNSRRGSGLTSDDIQEIKIHLNEDDVEEVWIATWGGGVIRLIPDLNEVVDDGTDGPRPLTTAYPNPYRAGEEDRDGVAFMNVPVGGTVEIYTITGEFIEAIDGPADAVEAETLEPTWDLMNEENVPVASGVYFFTVRIDGALYQTGKIAYVR